MFCSWPDIEIKYKAWQVVEIEELKNNAMQENQGWKGQISELEERIKELEKNKSHTFSSDEQVKVCFVMILLFWLSELHCI